MIISIAQRSFDALCGTVPMLSFLKKTRSRKDHKTNHTQT